jgi:hypothetical protein
MQPPQKRIKAKTLLSSDVEIVYEAAIDGNFGKSEATICSPWLHSPWLSPLSLTLFTIYFLA